MSNLAIWFSNVIVICLYWFLVSGYKPSKAGHARILIAWAVVVSFLYYAVMENISYYNEERIKMLVIIGTVVGFKSIFFDLFAPDSWRHGRPSTLESLGSFYKNKFSMADWIVAIAFLTISIIGNAIIIRLTYL